MTARKYLGGEHPQRTSDIWQRMTTRKSFGKKHPWITWDIFRGKPIYYRG
jgi:hypothetical protein